MKRVLVHMVALVVVSLLVPVVGRATDLTLHFHKEINTTWNDRQLLTTDPEPGSVYIETPNLKNYPAPYDADFSGLQKEFLSTAPGTRVIPANTVVTFNLWVVKVSGNYGVFYPKF